MLRHGCLSTALTALFLFSSATAFACTGIALKATDGSNINGRTIEFGLPLNLSVIIIPHNYAFQGTLPDETGGLTFRAKYASVGTAAFGENTILDGMNEKGLSVGAFYFPGYAGYAPITPATKIKAVSATEFSTWILTQFTTVDEVKAALPNIAIVTTKPKGWPGLPPLHYIVYDQTGKSIVIEPIKGKLKVYDNPIGTLTNSPTFAWQLSNLSNYINLSPLNPGPSTIKPSALQQFVKSAGLHGLPGDFNSPSRFIRAAFLSTIAAPSDKANTSVLQAFHLLSQFDIPIGKKLNTPITTVKDTKNLIYYYQTYDDQTIKFIAFSKLDLNSKTLKTITLTGTTPIIDVSTNAK
jgi:choloylglycine hydrolase